jgi:hypothetical protein
VLLRIQDFWDVTLCCWVTNSHHAGSILNCLILKALHSFKISRTTHPVTECDIPEDMNSRDNSHPRRHEFPRQFSHLDKKLPTVYDTCRFITIFKTSLPLCLPPSQINPFTLPHPIYLRPILTLTSHASLV